MQIMEVLTLLADFYVSYATMYGVIYVGIFDSNNSVIPIVIVVQLENYDIVGKTVIQKDYEERSGKVPNHHWQRETNETPNGLLREYLSKGQDLKEIIKEHI